MRDLLNSAELMARVFTYLPPQQALKAGETCKSWHVASQEPALWRAQTKQVFAAPVLAHENPMAVFKDRWVASHLTLDTLLVPATRHLPVPQLEQKATAMANPHRLQVSNYILDRIASGIPMRLDAKSVTDGIERAMTCAHISDRPAVAARGATLQACYRAREPAKMRRKR